MGFTETRNLKIAFLLSKIFNIISPNIQSLFIVVLSLKMQLWIDIKDYHISKPERFIIQFITIDAYRFDEDESISIFNPKIMKREGFSHFIKKQGDLSFLLLFCSYSMAWKYFEVWENTWSGNKENIIE